MIMVGNGHTVIFTVDKTQGACELQKSTENSLINHINIQNDFIDNSSFNLLSLKKSRAQYVLHSRENCRPQLPTTACSNRSSAKFQEHCLCIQR